MLPDVTEPATEEGVRTSLRLRFHRLIWTALVPVTWFVRRWARSPLVPYLVHGVVKPLMPPAPATFTAEIGPQRRVALLYSELLGTYVYLYGAAHEEAEVAALARCVEPGTVAIDVGAHAGIVTTALAAAVGPDGRVWSIEAGPQTAARLRRTVELSALGNVEVIEAAASDAPGELLMDAGADPSLAGRATAGAAAVSVPAITLDSAWVERGRPAVSALKIDVEGAEPAVIRGAAALLDACRPAILAEANGDEERDAITALLTPFGYERAQPDGFAAFNYLFLAKPR
jgi:FkbM family methyltransferase